MMSNPLFGMFGNQQAMTHPVLQRFQQFKRMFSGNPQQQVQQMLQSGRISQAQYNQAVQMANQMMKMMGGK